MRLSKAILIGLITCLVLSALLLGACQRQEAAPGKSSSSPAASDNILGLHTTKATGEKKLMVILADFPDVKRQYPEQTISDRMLGFVANYFREASYNKMSFKGEMTKRYLLPNPVSNYKISARNLEVDPKRVTSLVQDVANAADSDVKFSEDLYLEIVLGATQAEYGMVGYCAVPGMLGWQDKSSITNKSGEIINNAAVFCENAHLGTFVHDTLHMLGGAISGKRMTPCLYDHELQAKYTGGDDWSKIVVNMGYWDPLSSHMPYKKELPPAGLSSWTKMRLGWIDASKIALVNPGQTTTVKLDPLADASSATMAVKIPLTSSTYYLIENRQKVSSDVNLPSSGILVLYADDTVYECRNGKAPVKIMDANPGVPYLNDAAYDIGKKDTFVDSSNGITIKLLEKSDNSYKIQISAK